MGTKQSVLQMPTYLPSDKELAAWIERAAEIAENSDEACERLTKFVEDCKKELQYRQGTFSI